MMNDYTRKQIDRLQDNLFSIRKAGGWTAAEFGDMIGVTKQTVRNLENHTTSMTKTQYIATRAVLDYEAKANPDNEVLSRVVNYLLDADQLTSADEEKIKSAVAYVSGAKNAGIEKSVILNGVIALVGAAAAALLTSSSLSSNSWYDKIIHNDKRR